MKHPCLGISPRVNNAASNAYRVVRAMSQKVKFFKKKRLTTYTDDPAPTSVWGYRNRLKLKYRRLRSTHVHALKISR